MPIGRPLDLTANVATKNITATATASQTQFTVTGGYRINEIGVYRNGVRLVDGVDFTAQDGSVVNLLTGATEGDVIEFAVFDSFNVANTIKPNEAEQTISGELNVTGGINVGVQSGGTNITTGVITAINFVGTGNTVQYTSSTKTVDISISGSGGGGGLGTAINYADGSTATPFSYIGNSVKVTENLAINTSNAGGNTSYVVTVIPNVEISSGIAVTVGTGKTMIIDVLQIGDL